MPSDDRNQLNRLEEMKNKLFTNSFETRVKRRGGFSHSNRSDVMDSWKSKEKTEAEIDEKFFKKTSIFKKLFIFSIIFFVLTLGYASYVFFAGGNTVSNDNIDISIIGNNFSAGGEELQLIVGITNKNNSSLDLADLVMEYPKGSTGDLSSNTTRFRESLGTIPAGAVRNQTLKVILFGEQGSVRPVRITLEYRVAGSNAIFVKEKLYEVTISSAPINLLVDAPLTISPNQDITLNVKATLNATKAISKVLIKVNYPTGFQFVKSVPAPSFGNNIWNVGSLAVGGEYSISISGKMIDVFDGEEKAFIISSGSQSATDKSAIDVVFNSTVHTISIKKPFIEASLYINGVSGREYATDSKTPINAEIRYVNNLDTKITDLQINAKISGNAFDPRTIKAPDGFYDSQTDTISWNKNFQSQFQEVNPGDSNSVTFLLSPLSLFGASGDILSDPSIDIEVSISGKQNIEGYAINELKNSNSATVRIISDVGFSAKALHFSGPFTNTGPVPAKVGLATTYTVVWSLSNTANNISNVKVNATLPSWVTFVGSVSPDAENLAYNSYTKEITWNVDRIAKGVGINTAPRTVSFQISFVPSISQIGASPVIINEALLTGHDDFANVDVKVKKASLNTYLDADAAFPLSAGPVIQ